MYICILINCDYRHHEASSFFSKSFFKINSQSQSNTMEAEQYNGAGNQVADSQGSTVHQKLASLEKAKKALQAENDRLAKENQAFQQNNARSQLFVGSFNLQVLTTNLPKSVDPNRTILSAMVSKSVSEQFHRTWVVFSIPLLLSVLAGVSWAFLSVIGLVPQFPQIGYISVCVIPSYMLSCLHFNIDLCRALLRSFSFWAFVTLITISHACMLDVVLDEPARVVSVVVIFFLSIFILFQDAKIPTQQRDPFLATVYAIGALLCVTSTILWYCSQWRDFRQTRIDLKIVQIDVASVGFSFYGAFSALLTKYAVSAWVSREANPMFILKPSLSYRWVAPDLSEDGSNQRSLVANNTL